MREETHAVLSNTYRAVAAATARLPTLSPSLDDRLTSLEKIVAQLMGTNGTIQHLFESFDVLNCNYNSMREELDCRTSPRKRDETSTSSVNNMQDFQ